ncbi:MAG TPA: HAMP domain-containing sensor histidine kinase [Tepidisphaeraceae bacterium]|nr:HAMP domain-containing sensor histidine kinase [Tepidisphaeraceae bacterium]
MTSVIGLGYVVAAGAIVSALVLRELLAAAGYTGIWPLFIGAVLVSTVYGGVAPGLVTSLLSMVVGGWLLLQHHPAHYLVLQVMVFGLVAILTTVLWSVMRRRLLEAELACKTAESASAAKSRLLAVVSHELRAPLDPVVLISEMLKREPWVPPSIREDLQIIRRNVDLEVRLLDDVVALARAANGGAQLKAERIDLHDPLLEAVQVCQPEAVEKNIDLALRLFALNSHVCGDPMRLDQVFWNLIRNAIKFTPMGGRISVSTCDGPEGRVIVEVTDTGIGIDPEHLSAIFGAFQQGGKDIASRFGGMGLGLAICQALTDAHRGTLSAASPGVGKGATFRVCLPTVPPPNGRTAARGSRAEQQQGQDAPAEAGC